jgi:hypothetical protein
MWQRRIKYSMLNRVAKKVYAQSFYAQSCFTGRVAQFRKIKRFLITSGNLKSTAVSNVSVSEPNDPRSSARTISDTNKQLNLNIFYISVACEDTAIQPVISFPRTFIFGKQRSFQSSWYNTYCTNCFESYKGILN